MHFEGQVLRFALFGLRCRILCSGGSVSLDAPSRVGKWQALTLKSKPARQVMQNMASCVAAQYIGAMMPKLSTRPTFSSATCTSGRDVTARQRWDITFMIGVCSTSA